ncbi:hypothetical protein IWW48_002156 [Coemansia sp. RSA 1200]|nr:hypothetical protein IWW48_002156 [Coemansia sp. RSA 1200]
MYNSGSHGAQSFSTPASPNSHTSTAQHSTEGKVTYDKELAALFRATAANVTQLYKEASEIGNNAFKAGYEQCFNDICEYIVLLQQQQQQQQQQQDGGSEPSAEAQQLVAQRLLDFARRKHLTQHHIASQAGVSPPGFARMGNSETRPSSVTGYTQSGYHQNHQSTDRDSDTGIIFDNQACQDQHTAISLNTNTSAEGVDFLNQSPLTTTTASLLQQSRTSNAGVHGDGGSSSGMNPECEKNDIVPEVVQMNSQSNNNSSDQRHTMPHVSMSGMEHEVRRGKRILENFDMMEIEPPRQRVRRDDIDMA